MNWSRVKTILIMLFLFTDIMLAFGIIMSDHRASVIEPEIISNAVQLLSERGITINPDIIPKKNKNADYVEAVNVISDYGSFAEVIMGETPDKIDDFSYETEHDTIVFSGDRFVYSIKKAVLPCSGDESHAQETAAEFLSGHGFNISHADIKCEKNEYGFDVIFSGMSEKKPIFNSNIRVSVTGTEGSSGEAAVVTKVAGSWFNPTDEKGSEIKLKSIPGILVELISLIDSSEKTSVTGLTLGYTVFEDDTLHRSATLIPAWRITLDNDREYFLDARNTD